MLEGLLPFRVGLIKHRFIGTERGSLTADLRECDLRYHRKLLPRLHIMEQSHPWHASVIHRYLSDMRQGFRAMKKCLAREGKLVIVCGDNLIAGYRVPTWKMLSRMLEDLGFQLQERFGDKIDRRNVPPKRQGHKGLIKQEVISVFARSEKAERL